jgi:Fe-S cluster assembly protein SufD
LEQKTKNRLIPETTDLKTWLISTFNKFENHLNGNADHPFHRLRREAIEHFARLGFPTTRLEEWKYTNLQPLLNYRFLFFENGKKISAATIEKFLIEQKISDRLE